MRADRPGSQVRLNFRAERILADYAYRQGRAGVAIGFRRPLDELGKIVQKSQFDWVLEGVVVQRKRVGRGREEPTDNDQEAQPSDSARILSCHETPSP